MGFYQAMYAFGMLFGPLASGFIADRYGLPVIFYLCMALCLIVCALGFLPVVRQAWH
jgi:MFS family permease